MTRMLDQEPTQAADTLDAETQAIQAWSQADDAAAVTTYIPRRSWKIPATVITFAATAALSAGAFLVWPESTTKPQVAPTVVAARPTIAPSPPVQPQSPDQRFTQLFKSRGGLIEPGREQTVLTEAHQVCDHLQQETHDQFIANIIKGTPGMTRYTAQLFVDTASDVYCPGVK